MKSKATSFAFVACLILFVSSCKKDPVKVEFMKFQIGVALFTVENNTAKDIYSIVFEIRLFAEDKSILKIDTVSYSNTSSTEGNTLPFLKSGEETFFPYSLTKQTVKTSAKVLSYEFER